MSRRRSVHNGGMTIDPFAPATYTGFTDAPPATEAQLSFLRKLVDEHNTMTNSVTEIGTDLDKASASTLIGEFKAMNAELRAARHTRREAAAEGMYRTADGTVYKVVTAHYGDAEGFRYAKRLHLVPRTDGELHADHPEWTHKGSFIKERGAQFKLTPAELLPLDEAIKYGKLYGFCVRCGAILEDETSIAQGMGPVCITK